MGLQEICPSFFSVWVSIVLVSRVILYIFPKSLVVFVFPLDLVVEKSLFNDNSFILVITSLNSGMTISQEVSQFIDLFRAIDKLDLVATRMRSRKLEGLHLQVWRLLKEVAAS